MDSLRGARRGRGMRSSRGSSRGHIRQSFQTEDRGNQRHNLQGGGRGRGQRGGRGSHAEASYSQANCTGSQDVPRPIGYGLLKVWTENADSEDLLMQLCNKIELLEELMMRGSMKEDWYHLLIRIVNSAILCQHHVQKLKKLLKAVSTTHFLTQMLSNYLDQKQMHGMRWVNAEDFFNSVLKIVKQVVKHLPEYAQNCKFALKILQLMLPDIEPVSTNDELREGIVSLSSIVTKVQTDRNERQAAAKTYRPSLDSDTPPEDFRQLSVVPTVLDLSTDTKPFVRAVITKGEYKDQEHYLDVQFRLMREDFFKPLRNGIKEYHDHGCDKKFKSSDIRIYYDVHFTGMTHVNGINHVIQFDVSNMKHVKWDHSKRLLTGNLLCLSNDNFTSTMIFATVSFRKTDMLKDGVVNIVCHSGLDIILRTSSMDSFIMAETMAYYEAVHPILKGLQTIDSDLPLKDYIIKCQKNLKPPSYLLKNVRKYDISCLMKTARSTEVSVLNTSSWPSSEVMCLNPSQRDAAMLALTKEISIIQGPPGTGKTYVGLKVMQVLLENQGRMLANENSDHDPILVICYTNHALDQFLEGILEFCPEGIVRVGGKSSSAVLEPFNLVSVKRNKRTKSKAWKQSLWNIRRAMDSHILEIEDVKRDVESLVTDILSEDILLDCMSTEHLTSLQSRESEGGKGKRRSKIHLWLNASNKSLLQSLPDMIKQHMIQQVMKILNLKGRKNQNHFDSMAPVIDRINIYGFWLSQYQNSLRAEMEAQQDPNERKRYGAFYDVSTRMSILNDSEICQVIHQDFLHQISDSLGPRFEDFTDSNSCLEAWVLGLHNDLSKQLDDVETMNRFIEKSQKREGEDDNDFDDKEATETALQHRQVHEDDNDEAKNLKATLQVRNGGLFLLNRAKLLGVNEDPEEEGNERHQPTEDADGFTLVSRKKHFSFAQVKQFLSNDKFLPATEDEEASIGDVWSLGMRKRFGLYKLWLKRYKDTLITKIERLLHLYNDTKQELTETRMKEDIDVLRQAKVIGMTTTGAAKKRTWLEAVGCRIIIVEEAAEVLEAHIVTALNENCKHLILIGDHKQLRPNPTVYEHAKNFGLDVSLFERLVINEVPHVTLSEQHRMRESISVIMRHIYPCLQDHISVKGYENIRGVSKNIFFIQHKEKEESVKDTMSKSNPYEAEYLTRLCNYFLLQGYKPSQITVLATYAGQVFALKKEMKKNNLAHGFRVTVVDNFQGEENDIILLSLVRSNERSIAGFLKVDNRVCVALSRAKKGMFAIGNIELLASQSDLWKKIKESAEKEGITGDGLPVACPNHPNEKNVMRIPRDFDRCPQGGCHKKCDFPLDCGHACYLQCHGYNLEHKDFKCNSACVKTCKEGHPCRKECWQKCGECTIPVPKLISACGHTNPFPCNMVPKVTDCVSQCGYVMPCGHSCAGKCGECKRNGKHTICKAQVTYFWPCDHDVKVPCHFKPPENACPKPCGEILQCGHECPGKCSDCLKGAVHMACTEKCRSILFCGHICQGVCGVPCPPCFQPCPVVCHHAPCSHRSKKRTCGELCIPCQETCVNGCPHRKCSRKCHETCDVLPCQKPCLKVVGECGHPCTGLCGEMCVCRKCETVTATCKQATAKGSDSGPKNDKTDFLYKLTSCEHVFNLSEIDQYMRDEDKRKKDSCEFILCPKCSVPIQRCWRYEATYKLRAERRLQEKKIVQTVNEITPTVRWNIQESLRLVQDRDSDMVWFDLRHLDTEVLKTAGEIVTVSTKLKLAYAICEILSLGEPATSSHGNDLDETKRIKALLRVNKTMSCQQIEEFKLDQKRILMSRYLDVLSNMAQNYGIRFEEDTTTKMSLVCAELKKPKLTDSIVEQGIGLANTVEHFLMADGTNSNLQALMMIKMSIVKRVLNVLNLDCDKMLNEVLESPSPSKSVAGAKSNIGTSGRTGASAISCARNITATRSITSTSYATAKGTSGNDGISGSTSTSESDRTTSTKPPDKRDVLDKFLGKMGFFP